MKFDGYGATIHPDTVKPQVVLDLLADTLHTIPAAGPTMKRWGQTIGFHSGPDLAAWVGVQAETGLIYIEGKGDNTPAWVSALRREIPNHSAPRIDVAEDLAGDGVFEELQALVRAHKGPRVKGGYKALPDDDSEGRTWAAGVRGGVAYIRVYEPGKMKERIGLFPANAARIELEARPQYARDKAAAARMTPSEVWGLTAWTHKVGCALTQSEIARFEAETRSYSFDKTTRYIAMTFRRHLEEMMSDGEHLESAFRAVWQEEDERQARLRRH